MKLNLARLLALGIPLMSAPALAQKPAAPAADNAHVIGQAKRSAASAPPGSHPARGLLATSRLLRETGLQTA